MSKLLPHVKLLPDCQTNAKAKSFFRIRQLINIKIKTYLAKFKNWTFCLSIFRPLPCPNPKDLQIRVMQVEQCFSNKPFGHL